MARPTPDILASLGQGGDDAVSMAVGPQVIGLNIADVRLDGGTQPRAGIDQAVVEDYANDMQANGDEFPPVQVVYDGQAYWLWDGFHRLHARKRNGLYTVPAIVRQGTRRDAVLLSVGANAKHGFRRTTQDKQRAIETLLRDDEWVMWSDREIARRCAVDGKSVAARRSALSAEIPQIGEERRAVRKGTAYTVSVPKRQPAPAVASAGAVVEEIDQSHVEALRPSTNGRAAFASEQVVVVDWRRMSGTVTEDGRILVQMSDGTKNPPWLELDDAGQHWMLDMIHKAQEVRR